MTPQWKRVLDFVSEQLDQRGVSPTHDEIADHLGLRSKSGVNRILNCLVRDGHFVKRPWRARGLSKPITAAQERKILEAVAAHFETNSSLSYDDDVAKMVHSWSRKSRGLAAQSREPTQFSPEGASK